MESAPTPEAKGAGAEHNGHPQATPTDYTPRGINGEPKEWALALAALGFQVGPLKGKRPLTPHGVKDFTHKPATVENWWHRYPNANIGARVPEGYVVLDIDPRNGGNETWEEITALVSLPKTLVVTTGSGGKHYWFKLPDNVSTRGSAGPGIDIKTHTGYLVMPGSTHPDTRGPYVVDTWVGPNEIAELPPGLCPHVYKKQHPKPVGSPRVPADPDKRRAGLVNEMKKAPEGQRNNTLYRVARRNYEENLGCEQELRDAALHTGLPLEEIDRTLASARRGSEEGAASK